MPEAGRRSHLRLVPATGDPATRPASPGGRGGAERERLLRRAAERAAEEEFYLAARLRRYRELEGIDELELMRRLGANAQALARLSLCRAPDPAQPSFRTEVAAIATYAGVSATALMPLLRRVQVSEAALQTNEMPELLAARDRELREEPARYSPPDEQSTKPDDAEDAPC